MSKQNVPARKPDSPLPGGLPVPRHDGEFVGMQDLLPVIASFQEHLENEQRQHRRRLIGLGVLFILVMGSFLCAPVYLARIFMEQNQQQMDIYLAAQEDMSRSLRSSLRAMTRASEMLRMELARENPGEAVPPTSDVPPAVEPAASVGESVNPAPSPSSAMQAERMAAVEAVDAAIAAAAPPADEAGRIMLEQPTPAEVTTQTPEFAAVPPLPEPSVDASRERAEKDLEGLLKQVEAAIDAKAKELEERKAARSPYTTP